MTLEHLWEIKIIKTFKPSIIFRLKMIFIHLINLPVSKLKTKEDSWVLELVQVNMIPIMHLEIYQKKLASVSFEKFI